MFGGQILIYFLLACIYYSRFPNLNCNSDLLMHALLKAVLSFYFQDGSNRLTTIRNRNNNHHPPLSIIIPAYYHGTCILKLFTLLNTVINGCT
jgi:hypothetical protein